MSNKQVEVVVSKAGLNQPDTIGVRSKQQSKSNCSQMPRVEMRENDLKSFPIKLTMNRGKKRQYVEGVGEHAEADDSLKRMKFTESDEEEAKTITDEATNTGSEDDCNYGQDSSQAEDSDIEASSESATSDHCPDPRETEEGQSEDTLASRPEDLPMGTSNGAKTIQPRPARTRQPSARSKEDDAKDSYSKDSDIISLLSSSESEYSDERPTSRTAKKAHQKISFKGTKQAPLKSSSKDLKGATTKKPESKASLRRKATQARKNEKESKKVVEDLQEQLKEKKDEIKSWKLASASIASKLNSVTGSIMERANKARRSVDNDQEVRTKFENMLDEWKPWALEYAIDSFVDLNKLEREVICDFVQNTLSSSGSDPLKGVMSNEMQTRGPKIVLTAFLARFMLKRFFGTPFFFLNQSIEGDVKRGSQLESSLTAMYQCLQKGNEENAERWRLQTHQALVSNGFPFGTKDPAHKGVDAQELMDGYYDDALEQLIANKMFSLLLKKVDRREIFQERQESLKKLIKTAGTVACGIWANHMVRIEVWGTRASVMECFSIDSPVMEPHPSMRRHLEQNSHALDGRLIDLVIQPAITAYGSEEGENYGKYKVWAKAIVWFHHENGGSCRD